MKTAPQFIYFDIGGVLLRWKQLFDAIAIKYGKTHTEIEEVFLRYDDLACKGEITSQDVWREVCQNLHISTEDDIDFITFSVESFTPIPEMHTLVKTLAKNYTIGLLTNVHTGVFEAAYRKALIPRISYQVIIKSCDVKLAKPQREIFEYAQKKAGVIGKHILYIDDFKPNILAAQSLGWDTIHFNTDNPKKSIEEIKKWT